ncbi:MAG: amidohydrolase family protein [Candidatus Latescibacteria bacterium]|jgi:hypothetical protein|nr:amidohydrolase family protein [Candidatus Latescibacterota bacterium]MDP7449632.1 amidohydrolase family protein [Candidatus Latescibacterota bacterium]HJP29493.1 amidohydrolase family protein [Candidatus Latescibacterota bacterium]
MSGLVWTLGFILFLGLRMAGAVELSGSIRYTDGTPVWGARVTIASELDSRQVVTVLTDAAGAYRARLTPDPPTAVASPAAALPGGPELYPNYPNPFNPETQIPFRLARPARVQLTILNSAGQPVRHLVDGFRDAGMHLARWDATSNDGVGVGAGTYFYRLETDGLVRSGKMLLLDGHHGSRHSGASPAITTAARRTAVGFAVRVLGYGFDDVHRTGITASDMPFELEVERVVTALGVDGHQHLDGVYRDDGVLVQDYLTAAGTAMSIMDPARVGVSIIMPPPISADPEQRGTYDYTSLTEVAELLPERFAVAGGGGILNPMIHAASLSGELSDETRDLFRARADSLVAAGVAAFGEMTALHLSFFEGHPFIGMPPNHQLFKDLADVSARTGVPIDLHMEAVAADKPLRADFGEPNPDTLSANTDQLEDLLRHNRNARIVWAHIGWDNTGDMKISLLRDLLEAHDNLYLALKLLEQAGLQVSASRPVDDSGILRDEWLTLISDYPDRFLLGADEFFGIPGLTTERPPSTMATWSFLEQLPEDLARRLSWENARAVYRLSPATMP